MEENQTNQNVKIYELGFCEVSVDRLKYSLLDIQMENISRNIRDDTLRTAIMNQEQLQEQIDYERELLLNDLALLENCGDFTPHHTPGGDAQLKSQ